MIVEAPLPVVAPLAHSCKTQVAAGASSTPCRLKVAAKVVAGCPSFGGQRTVASDRTKEKILDVCQSISGVQSKHQTSNRLHCVGHESPALSRSTNLQVQFKRRAGSLCIRHWYASPSK